jgi:monoamine oxidase
MTSTVDVLIVGGGAAGIGASLRLTAVHVPHLIVEARSRLGGRGWTIADVHPLDMGCGWLHSADENPWTGIAATQGRTIDRTPPPWTRPSTNIDMPLGDQADFGSAFGDFYDRLHAAKDEPDRPASSLLKPNGRWNTLLNAVSTYINGAELDRVSMHDFALYHDTEVNWRIKEGYGATIAAAAGDNVLLDCPVAEIDHSGGLISVRTAKGMLTAKTVIVTISSALIAQECIRFTPALPKKSEAAANLPLGLANKLFLALDNAEEFEPDSRVFGDPKDAGTAAYHIRPFGRPLIEAYFGGSLADDLEREGGRAFIDFATQELTGLMGSGLATRIRPIRLSQWRKDEYALGSYSYARPGCHNDRARLAKPVDNRIFFAGEACSPTSYSTAHGAYHTGVAAAAQAMAALGHDL